MKFHTKFNLVFLVAILTAMPLLLLNQAPFNLQNITVAVAWCVIGVCAGVTLSLALMGKQARQAVFGEELQ